MEETLGRHASTSETAQITVSKNSAKKILEKEGSVVIFMSELNRMYDRLESMGKANSD